MSFKSSRINEVRFSIGSLTADADGLFNVYTSTPLNGAIQKIFVGSNTYTNTGSLLFFVSGTTNGVNNQGLILQLRAGSRIQDFYPVRVVHTFDGIQTNAGSIAYAQSVINTPLRIVGSGLGNGTSGLGVIINYM